MSRGPLKQFASWKHIVGIIVTAVALWLVFRRVNAASLLEVLGQARLGWFAASIAVFGTACVLGAWRWHLMLRLTDSAVHAGASLRAFFVGHCFNFSLFGCTAGDVAKAMTYSRWHGVPLPRVVATSPIDRLLGFAGLLLFTTIGVVLAVANNAMSKATDRFSISIGWLLAAALLVVASIVLILRWRPRGDSFLTRAWNTFADGLVELARTPHLAANGLLLGFLVQTCFSVVFILNLIAVTQTPLPLDSMLWAFPVISLATLIPSVGGLGVREGLAMTMLALFGVPAADAVAAALLALSANLFWVIVGGGMLWREERLHKEHSERQPPRTISVVIPTLNEAALLQETVARARAIPEVCEIIVADGGSHDGTLSVAEELGCTVVQAPTGRGGQMQQGSAVAKGDAVLLLHADTWLPSNAGEAIRQCFQDATVVGGGFWKEFRDPDWLLAGSRWRCAPRLFLFRRILGDQAMFIRRDVLEAIGGVPALPLMEEYELCRRLREVGRLALAPATVTTSARRFARLGMVRTYWRMNVVTLKYHLGVEPHELARIYDRE